MYIENALFCGFELGCCTWCGSPFSRRLLVPPVPARHDAVAVPPATGSASQLQMDQRNVALASRDQAFQVDFGRMSAAFAERLQGGVPDGCAGCRKVIVRVAHVCVPDLFT